MKRLVIAAVAAVAAGGIAATPALASRVGPSHARHVSLTSDDRGGKTRHAEPGDDRGVASPGVEPGDDRSASSPGVEPGDDRGVASPEVERGDDHRGASPAAEPGDDRGGSRSGGGGDSSGRSGS